MTYSDALEDDVISQLSLSAIFQADLLQFGVPPVVGVATSTAFDAPESSESAATALSSGLGSTAVNLSAWWWPEDGVSIDDLGHPPTATRPQTRAHANEHCGQPG
jgi:hypothetical protein